LTSVKLGRETFIGALDLDYEKLGWDVPTGLPRETKLYHLNIADMSQF
jgi:aldehyde:ferredoxin oxidoreductase